MKMSSLTEVYAYGIQDMIERFFAIAR